MKKLLTSLIVLGGLAVVSPEAQAQAYPFCVLGYNGNALYAAPGGPQIGYAPGGAAIRVTQVGPVGWRYVVGDWGGGWVAGGYIDPGCIPVNVGCYGGCAPVPAPCYNGCTPTRSRERHVWNEHHEVENERGWTQPVPTPYNGNGNGYNGNGNGGYNGNGNGGYNGNGNGHEKGQYQEAPAPNNEQQY